MSKKFPLQVLQDLAQNRSDEATRALGAVMSEEQAMQHKLDLLLKYREDYREKFRAAIRTGMNQMGWRNYQDFLDKLERAIDQQRAALAHSRHATSLAREEWRVRQSRLKAYDTLSERHQQRAQKAEARREQREQDEIAGMAHSRTVLG